MHAFSKCHIAKPNNIFKVLVAVQPSMIMNTFLFIIPSLCGINAETLYIYYECENMFFSLVAV